MLSTYLVPELQLLMAAAWAVFVNSAGPSFQIDKNAHGPIDLSYKLINTYPRCPMTFLKKINVISTSLFSINSLWTAFKF